MTPPEHDPGFDLEQELRRALRPIEPAKDFSALPYAKSHRPGWMWMAAAAALVLMIVIPVYRARERAREQAHADLIRALSITQNKLEKTRQMVVRQLDRSKRI